MLRNIVLITISLAALGWIGYVGMNMTGAEKKNNPESFFGREDGQIFVLHRPNEILLTEINFELPERLTELFQLLSSRMEANERLFVSKNKAHILLQFNNLKDKKEISRRFPSGTFHRKNEKIQKWKDFEVTFSKGFLNFQLKTETINPNNLKWATFDKKSACSVVTFEGNEAIVEDYFPNNDFTTIFTRKKINDVVFNNIDDKSLFFNEIPTPIHKYQFAEKKYLTLSDKKFDESYAANWVKTGVVAFEYNSSPFLLVDVFDNQEPFQALEKYRDTSEKNGILFSNLQITEDFPKNKTLGFYAITINDKVVFSENLTALTTMELAVKMNRSLANDARNQEKIFSNLPVSVFSRIWNSESKIAQNCYQHLLLTTEIKSRLNKVGDADRMPVSTNFSMQNKIEDFNVHPEMDWIVACDNASIISSFKNGKIQFTQKVSGGIIQNLEWCSVKQDQFYFCGNSQLNLWNSNGLSGKGFPVEIANGIDKGAKCFSWKGVDNFLVCDNSGVYFWLDENGKTLQKGETGLTDLLEIPKVWLSANKLFFGFRNSKEFRMIEAENGKLFRSFPVPKDAVTTNIPNEIQFFFIENQKLIKLDQKGNKTVISNLKNPIWLKKSSKNKAEGFFVKEGSSISHFDSRGILVFKTKIPVETIDFLSIEESLERGMIFGVIDGLANQLKLFDSSGKLIQMEENYADKKYLLRNQNDATYVYRIVDKFIVSTKL